MRASAYGLGIRSTVPLNGLSVSGPEPFGTVDLAVEEVALEDVAGGAGVPSFELGLERTWRLLGGERLTRYEARSLGAAWAMRVGSERIDVQRTAGLPGADVLALVKTIGLVTALQARGAAAILHGCAVEVDERALVVLGASGAGKSTTAAAFVRAGHRLLSDDIAVVDGTAVMPGAPRLHLTPQTAAGMGWGDLPRVFATEVMGDKRYLALDGGRFCPEAREIAGLYLLGPRTSDPEPAFATVSGADALHVLAANVFRSGVLDRAERAALLPALARLASSVPIRRVSAPDHLARVDAVVEAIAADAAPVA